MTFIKKSIRVLALPYILTVIVLFLLSILQEVSIMRGFNWSIILVDFAMDVACISVAFFYFFLNKLYVTESKLLSSNNTLSETNYELESFIYRASHDFRTPLTNIKGLLIAYEHDKNAETAHHYLELLSEAADMMDSRLLELMEITTNKHKMVTSERIDAPALVKELINELSFTTSLDNITISIESADPVTIHSDTTRLKILLRNILVNAVKYKDTAKKKNMIRISISEENGSVMINFWDNGIGISEDTLPKVFEMFYRGTQLSNGSGLGLYIAKTIAITLDYTLSITSKEGEWTEVSLLIKKDNHSKKLSTKRMGALIELQS